MRRKMISCFMAVLILLSTFGVVDVRGRENFTATINGTAVIFDPPIILVDAGTLIVSTEAFANAIGARHEIENGQIHITYQNTYEVSMMRDVDVRIITSANILLGIREHSPIEAFAGSPLIIDGHFFVPLGALTRGLQLDDPFVDMQNRRVHITLSRTANVTPTPPTTPVPTPPPQSSVESPQHTEPPIISPGTQTAAESAQQQPPQPHESVTVGQRIPFGGYTWRVLDVQGDRALLLIEYVIGIYHHTLETAATWEQSSLRHWLNNEFFNSFSTSDRERIAQTYVVNNDNPWVGTPGGNNTHDRIFLLSLEEVVRYFGDSGQLANRPQGLRLDDEFNGVRIARTAVAWDWWLSPGDLVWWWLRSPGSRGVAAIVTSFGDVLVYGGYVFGVGGGVRPALWLNLGS